MAVTSFHAQTGRWLTSFCRQASKPEGALEGEVKVITLPLPWERKSEVSSYTLAAPVATNEYGENLFDLEEAIVTAHTGERMPLKDAHALYARRFDHWIKGGAS